MPRYRNAPNLDLEAFVVLLVRELQEGAQQTPPDPFATAGNSPVIIETPTGLGERFQVVVIWDRWNDISVENRNRIIMEAYRRTLGSESVNVSLTVGVTKFQYQQMTAIPHLDSA